MTLWSETNAQTLVPAFQDSVDTVATWGSGRCGEKTVTLTGIPLSFIAIKPGSDPIADPFEINYSFVTVTEADVGTHTISYEVAFTHYTGTGQTLTGSFDFEILCPTSINSSARTFDV